MKLFINWLFGSKAEETPDSEKQVAEDVECGSNVNQDNKAIENLQIKWQNMRHLNIYVSHTGSCKITMGKGPVTTERLGMFDKTMSFDDVLEYLHSVVYVYVHFKGPFEKTRDLMQKVNITWYKQQFSISVDITDGLEHFGSKDRHEWTCLILRIHRELLDHAEFNGNGERLTRTFCPENRMGYFSIFSFIDDDFMGHFVVKCPEMNIPYYDIAKCELSFVNRIFFQYCGRPKYEYAQRIIRGEADSYTEERDRIEFVMNGNKKIVCFKEDSDEDE